MYLFLIAKGKIVANVKLVCDRCLKDFIEKIDLIISRTIQKSMAKYSYEYLLNNDVLVFKDIQERVEDCVFSIQPYGFTVWSLSINKPENVILK